MWPKTHIWTIGNKKTFGTNHFRLKTEKRFWKPRPLRKLIEEVWADALSFSNNYCKDGPSLVAQLVKNPLAMWETCVWSLDWEDPLEKGKDTHSSILAWRIPWTCIVHGVAKSRTQQSDFHFTVKIRKVVQFIPHFFQMLRCSWFSICHCCYYSF